MHVGRQRDLAHDLVLPTLLFAALGAMTWAVRGCSGFGGMQGCIFAGVTWGTAWWFISHDPASEQSRRYSSAWIILALTLGIGLSGNRGWMQWPSFFAGHLQTNAAAGKFVPIPRAYGFLWLFIAGVPWAGLGACLLAWCAPARRTSAWQWALRLGCGFGLAILAPFLFAKFPSWFLPLYDSMAAQYADPHANPNLQRLINDNRAALTHLGLYVGFLGYELGRRDWKNVALILTVGLVNGAGWALCQNWHWAHELWPKANFNFWRCWESSGGISIGIAYGLAYYLVNRPGGTVNQEYAAGQERPASAECPNLERFGAYLGLLLGLGLSIRNGLKGWANIYIGNEQYWSQVLWQITIPMLIAGTVVLALWIAFRPVPPAFRGDLFPHAPKLIWTVLIIQNILAQLVTGPLTSWNEVAFSLYYGLLFMITGLIVWHYQFVKRQATVPQAAVHTPV